MVIFLAKSQDWLMLDCAASTAVVNDIDKAWRRQAIILCRARPS